MIAAQPSSVPVAMTIAGSDSGGGAGVQADLKTFAFHRVHGTCALTCITAQNTLGVSRVDALPPAAVVAQLEAVATDIGIQAAKTGMLLNREIIVAVVQAISDLSIPQLVVDPVMVSRAGAQLIDDAAIATLRDHLLPMATVVTPNRYEAQLLTGLEINSLEAMQQAAQSIYQLGPRAVLVKGGGMAGDLQGVDVWWDGIHLEVLRTERVNTPNTHGTGCTLAAAITANLARGQELWLATQQAKQYVSSALKAALSIGRGQGPLGHFFPLLGSPEPLSSIGIPQAIDKDIVVKG
jgi:hydroxymethylpyrimidine/phosphomethylpyrimidine kinase